MPSAEDLRCLWKILTTKNEDGKVMRQARFPITFLCRLCRLDLKEML